jgi:UDP-GlcNAc:undecaprenyl-phosphate GlcNAc-1-phosphate transferase
MMIAGNSFTIGASVAAFLTAFVFTVGLVAVTARVCRKYGWVAKPRADRWHKGTPAMFGGVPLWLGFVVACVIFLPWSSHLAWKLVGLSSLMFILGLVDDAVHLRPRSKFFLQLLATALVLSFGVIYPLRASLLINVIVSVVWIVGITNAVNLLDNMDGLSAGIAFIVSLYLIGFYISSGSYEYALLVSIAAGAIAGFLPFNFNPARIFMGDSGSLFIGFFLGTVSLLQVTHLSGVPNVVFAPVAVLAIPIFDTFFVSVTRRLRGQPVSIGGTDHSSHRLVSLGLSERGAVILLYVLAVGSGAIAVVARNLFYPRAIELVSLWYLVLMLFGIHLFRSGAPTHETSGRSMSPFLSRLLAYDTLALLLDPLVLSLSYYFAYFLRFKTFIPHDDISLFLRSWPIVVGAKFGVLCVFRIYRYSWWRGSMGDGYRLARAAFVGEVVAVLLLTGLYRFAGYSRVVFLVDGLVSWMLLLGLRKSFFLFKASVRAWETEKAPTRRVFVLGTSEHAAFAVSFLQGRRIQCAGLIDTNGGGDLNRSVWGAQVVGHLDDLIELADRYGVSEIVLPDNEELPCSEAEFSDRCRQDKLQLMKLGLHSANGNGNKPKAFNVTA